VRRALVVLPLLLAGCSQSSGAHDSLDRLCALSKQPHATAEQQAAVRTEAQDQLGRLQPFRATSRNKAIARAVLELKISGYGIPTDTPSPLASALTRNGTPFGFASFEAALTHLRQACEK
jgi:hypothetical protein